jgi:hypothetical protein
VKKMRVVANTGKAKNNREKGIAAGRKCLGDKRLEAFLRACRRTTDVHACELINEELDQGETLDSIFYTQDNYGYELAVRECGKDEFEIDFGYLAGELMGDGGRWVVQFDSDDRVKQMEEKDHWIS